MKNVRVRTSLIERLEHYSALSGQPIAKAVDEALEDFLNTTAEARIEAIQEMAGKVIPIEVLKRRSQAQTPA